VVFECFGLLSTGFLPMPDHASRLRAKGVVVCSHRRLTPALATSTALDKPALTYGGSRRIQSFLKRPGYKMVGITTENLRIHCPPALPVVVRPGNTGSDCDGFCVRTPNKFIISIDHTLSCKDVLNTLLHEWAHALSWSLKMDRAVDEVLSGEMTRDEFERVSHDANFGIGFANVWRVFSLDIVPILNMHAA
jgi:hypothetical protein